MYCAYSNNLTRVARLAGKTTGLNLKEGIYMFLTGPTYESPSEFKMARFLGADAVGMSTVAEVIVSVHWQMEILGISCITNMASGISDQPLSHKEVLDTVNKVKGNFIFLIKEILKKI